MELTLQQKMECPFPAKSVSWRIGRKNQDKTKAQLLAYIDARDVMERLDKACGFESWQCNYSHAENGIAVCSIGIRVNGEWLWRANGAGDSDVEAEKGRLSDAFKRAAVLWGVGRYLYELDTPWVTINQYGKWDQDPQLPEWATPRGFLAQLQAGQEKGK